MKNKYVAFSKVSHLSTDPYDRSVTDAALFRICIPRHPLGSNGEIIEQVPDKLECYGDEFLYDGGSIPPKL